MGARARGFVAAKGGSALGNITLQASVMTVGVPVVLNIDGATAGSALAATGLPTGLTLNSAARTITGTPTVIGRYLIGLTETLAGKAGSPKLSQFAVRVLAVAVPAPASAKLLTDKDLPAANAALGVGPAQATRMLQSAQRPLGGLTAVMSGVTITDPLTDGAPSTVNGRATNNPQYSVGSPQFLTTTGGPLLNLATSSWRPQTVTAVTGSRRAGHDCMAFWTYAPTVDLLIRANGLRWNAYVTDTDGIRRRISANDRVQAFSNTNYYTVAFGSVGLRLIEVYVGNAGTYGGVCVPANYTVTPYQPAEPRLLVIGDSFWENSMNNAALGLKLSLPDQYAAAWGVRNPIILGVGSTGVIATNSGANTNFQQRIDAGDIDISRIGVMDMIFLPGSINDDAASGTGGVTIPGSEATIQAAQQTYVASVIAKQPQAIIFGCGAEFRNGTPAVASMTAAYKAGFLAAAGSKLGSQYFWMDLTVFDVGAEAGVVGADNIHPGDVMGTATIGGRLTAQQIALLRASLGQ